MQIYAGKSQRRAIRDAGLLGKLTARRRPDRFARVNSSARKHQLAAMPVADHKDPAVPVKHNANAQRALARDAPPDAAKRMAACKQYAEGCHRAKMIILAPQENRYGDQSQSS